MELEDTASFLLGKSAVWVDQKVDSLKLTVENKDADKLNSIIFVNHTVFSWAKFLLVFSVLLLSYLFVSHCTFFGKRPEWDVRNGISCIRNGDYLISTSFI